MRDKETILREYSEKDKDHQWQPGDTAYYAEFDQMRGELVTTKHKVPEISKTSLLLESNHTRNWYAKAVVSPNELSAIALLYFRADSLIPQEHAYILWRFTPAILKRAIRDWFSDVLEEYTL